jgi:aspartate racemase
MPTLSQQLIPGIVGISTYVDHVYQKEMQLTAMAAAGTDGPINQLRTVTVTLDFNLLVTNLRAGLRNAALAQVADACQALERAGADFIVVTSGTTSTLTARAQERVTIPFLGLAEACWKQARPAAPVGLLSTSYAAAGGIFQAAAKHYGATLLLPSPDTAARVDQAIFGELIRGAVSAAGLRVFHDAIEQLAALGAASIILGNTDLTLAADELQTTTKIPLVDAARCHAIDAAHTALTGFG